MNDVLVWMRLGAVVRCSKEEARRLICNEDSKTLQGIARRGDVHIGGDCYIPTDVVDSLAYRLGIGEGDAPSEPTLDLDDSMVVPVSNPSGRFTIVCYGEKESFDEADRMKQMAKYERLYRGSEGCEAERYANVFFDLFDGKAVCKDV